MKLNALPRRLRLARRGDFLRVQQSRRATHGAFFLACLSAEPRGDEPARIGVTVTRKVGGAVDRNRIKRLVREGFRIRSRSLPLGLDVVFIAKRGAAAATGTALLSDVDSMIDKINKLAKTAEART